MHAFFQNLIDLSLDAAPWLVLGLVIGGLIKAWIPTDLLQRHLSGSGFFTVIKAALFGAPLPLCSCGVIPAALGLRRAGASKPATISFLVSTPETGVDSVSISYALLGPFMAIARPIAAIASAITAGLLVGKSEANTTTPNIETHNSCCSSETTTKETSCCSSKAVESTPGCCGSDSDSSASSCCSEPKTTTGTKQSFLTKARDGIQYSFTDLLDNVLFWLVIGVVFAALVKTFVPETFLASWGSGFVAMLVMLVVGIPMYVCATASTPIAAGLILAGISPGTALVFLMAGPATNIATMGVIYKELGRRSLMAYLTGVGVISLMSGYLVDYLLQNWKIDVQAQLSASHNIVPAFIAWTSLLLLIAVAVKLKLPKKVNSTTLHS